MNRTKTDVVTTSVCDRAEYLVLEFNVQDLLVALAGNAPQTDGAIQAGFDQLRRRAESLPLTTEDFSFAWNWITSARDLWKRGETGAARYQVEMLRKKLEL